MKEIRLNKSLSYRTYPHKCEPGSLDFAVIGYSLNGESSSEPETEQLVDVTEYEGWDTLKLELEVTIPEGLLGKVFPEFGKIPGMLVVAAHCRSTYLRERFVLARDPISSGTYSGTWEFDAQDVTGSLDLRPVLVRTTDRRDSTDSVNYATDAGVFVADGPEWRVEISDDEGEGEDLFEIRAKEFSDEHESNPDSRFPPADHMYYLDLESDAERPVLWLNEDHERVLPLLRDPEGRYEKLTSELAWNQVMTPVWTRLVTIAAKEYDPDEEEWLYEWQGAVFDELNDELYEDHTPEKAAERLQEDLSDSVEQATKRIDDSVQALLEPAKYYTKHVQTLSER
ncbi:hypothetical protein SAMN04487947_2019 [Halogeometricum rufum]|uniref:Uncharacterized protein n=1 Tax=Halogeometricum rufum TaxID=553469 RepID=A0A1I6HFX8_9EURY|nr:hypothetical protein [Halogeometricum rufum]SFR53321.1 hypothetical protein SAMN04487947_2019 [Halogeometricum rufum]